MLENKSEFLSGLYENLISNYLKRPQTESWD